MNFLMTPVATKNNIEIAAEWDAIAERRHHQITSKLDLSFDHVLCPTTLDLLQCCDLSRVLDVGCGTGEFTFSVAERSGSVLGIDVSPKCIKIAKDSCARTDNVSFLVGPLEKASEHLQAQSFTAAVAAMSLMTVPDLDAVVTSLSKLIGSNGHLVATLTHPWFWPFYWGYAQQDWFTYNREIFIESHFRISQDATDVITTHVHRPLEQFIDAFRRHGFDLERLLEPVPSAQIQGLYPSPWKYPRFIAMRLKKAV